MNKQYEYKFYLNAYRYKFIKDSEEKGEPLSITWELLIDILELDRDSNQFTQFSSVEKVIDEMLNTYQDKIMDEIPPFDKTNPTLENVCAYFKDIIEEKLINMGYLLLSIEMSPGPSRTFIIPNYDILNKNED